MSRDVDVSTFRAFLVRISAQQFQQYRFCLQISLREESCSCTIRSTLHPESSHLRGPCGSRTPTARASERGDRSGPGIAAVPRSQDACVIVPELQILTACHTEAGKC